MIINVVQLKMLCERIPQSSNKQHKGEIYGSAIKRYVLSFTRENRSGVQTAVEEQRGAASLSRSFG